MDSKSDINKDYFDSEKYKTVIVGKEDGEEDNSKDVSSLIVALCSVEKKNAREAALKAIKKEKNALDQLIQAINNKHLVESKVDLISACWESGIDCRPQLKYFVELAINEDYLCCIEALSVILGMDTPVDATALTESKKMLMQAIKKQKKDKKDLLVQMADVLNSLG